MKKLILSLALTSAAVSAHAYQFEAGVNYADNDAAETTGAFFNYHFADVDTSKGPLNESNFLSKSSYVGVSYATNDYVDLAGAYGRFVFGSDWTLGVSLADADSDFGGATAYGIAVGKYLNDHSELYLGYADSDEDGAEEAITLGYKSVVNKFAYSLEATTVDSEYTAGFQGMYYINTSFGVGAGAVYDSVSEDTNAVVMASYFFTPGVELEVSYQDESETVMAGVNFRF